MDHYMSQVFISLCLGFQVGVKALSTISTESTIFNVNAYFSEKRIVDFMISFSNSTWLEAQSTCLSNNGSLWGEDRMDLFLYIRILAHQKISWPEGSHIWLNRVRRANSTVWTNDKECGTGRSITEQVHKNEINSTQCLALNMTSPNDVHNLLFAAPCEEQMNFVCLLFKGDVWENKGYEIFPAHVLHPRDHTVSLSMISRGDCLGHLFGNFTCFAAEFDADISECSLFCPPLLLLPESIQFQWSTSNITSVVKTSSNIYMRYDIANSPAGHFPCENTTTDSPDLTGLSSVTSIQFVTQPATMTKIAEETTLKTSEMSTSTDFTGQSVPPTSGKYNDTSTKTTTGPSTGVSDTSGDTGTSTEENTTSPLGQTTLQSVVTNITSMETQSVTTQIGEDTFIQSTYTTTATEGAASVSTTFDSTVSQISTSVNLLVSDNISVTQTYTKKVLDYNSLSTGSLQTDGNISSTENESDLSSSTLSTESNNENFSTMLTLNSVAEDNRNPATPALSTEKITYNSVSGSSTNFENTDAVVTDSVSSSLGDTSNSEINMLAETTMHSVTFMNTVSDLQESITSSTISKTTLASALETSASATDSTTLHSSSNSPQTASLLFTSKTCTPCVCYNYTVTDKTSEQILKEIAEIKSNLTVKRSTLSSYTRQKISAPDGRWSSAALGSVGVVIIVAASILVILSDIQYVLKAIKIWKKRLEKYRSSRNRVP